MALGMHAGRDSLKEAVPFVAFLPSEREALAIRANQTLGKLPCAHANCLHHDIQASDEPLARPGETAMQNGRVAGSCSQGMMKDVVIAATNEKSSTVTTEGACQVASCSPG